MYARSTINFHTGGLSRCCLFHFWLWSNYKGDWNSTRL